MLTLKVSPSERVPSTLNSGLLWASGWVCFWDYVTCIASLWSFSTRDKSVQTFVLHVQNIF
jgi:hypothetical protein